MEMATITKWIHSTNLSIDYSIYLGCQINVLFDANANGQTKSKDANQVIRTKEIFEADYVGWVSVNKIIMS